MIDSSMIEVKVENQKDFKKANNSTFCQLCGKQITTKLMARHFKRKHTNTCHICFKFLETQENLQTHLKLEHYLDYKIACTVCGMEYSKKNMARHIKTVHPNNCHLCYKFLENGETLEDHLKSQHVVEKTKICQLCGIQNANSMPRHFKRKHKNTCHICLKFLETEKNLQIHLESEHEKIFSKNPYLSCATCSKRYGSKLGLKRHFETTHKNNLCCKDYENSNSQFNSHILEVHARFHCLKCKSVFSNYMNLEDHMISGHDMKKCLLYCEALFFQNHTELENHVISTHQTKTGITTNHEIKEEFECQTCGKVYTKKQSLDVHIANSCGQADVFRCSICKEIFKTRTLKFDHIASEHKNKKLYSCLVCKSRFLKEDSLEKHTKLTHGEPKMCPTCGKEFAYEQLLKKHIKTVHEGKWKTKYECPHCDVSVTQKFLLTNHIESVHEGKTYQCSYCGEVFESNGKLEGHIALNHDRSKLFHCDQCPKAYANKATLQRHISFDHENKGGHICSTCGKKYAIKSQLEQHVKTVHEGTTFPCRICQKILKTPSGLNTHMKIIHEGKKPTYQCTICDKSFFGSTCLKKHIAAVHEKKKPHACEVCGMAFSQRAHLKTHMKGKHKIAL